MRYEGTRESKGKNHTDKSPVHLFALGNNEVRLLRDLLYKYTKETVNVFEIMPSRSRAQNMRKQLEEALRGGRQEQTPKFKRNRF